MIATNQAVNALTGGDPQSSISSRLGEARIRGNHGAKAVCWMLERVDFHPPTRADHCDEAIRVHIRRLETGLKKATK